MTRRIAYVVAALLVPGGLVALIGIMLFKALTRTQKGRKAMDRVQNIWRRPLPAFGTVRQAA